MTTAGGSQPHLLRGKPKFLSTESYGLSLIGVSAALYSIMGAFVKLATQTGIPATELVFMRAVFQGSLVVVAMLWFREGVQSADSLPAVDEKEEQQLQLQQQSHRKPRLLVTVPLGDSSMRSVVIARGAVGGCGFILYFYTLSVLPLGDAIALLSLSPVVTVWASAAILGEPVRPLHIVAAISTVAGSFLIARPAFIFGMDPLAEPKLASYNSFGYVTAAMGTCAGAAVFILIRKAGKSGAHTLQLLFSWVVFGLLFSFLLGVAIPLGKGGWYFPTSKLVWSYVLGCCVVGSIAHFLLNFAARHSNPGLASIVRSSGIVWAYLLQILLFGHIPTLLTCAGVVLVSTSLILVSVQKIMDGSKKENNPKSSTLEQQAQRSSLIPSAEPTKGYGTTESMEVRAFTSD